MNSELVQIEFYFPNEANGIKSKKELADLILNMMREHGSTTYAGHTNEESLYEGILQHLGNADIRKYKPLSKLQMQDIQKQIKKTILKCNDFLPIPTKNYVFVFPYLPTEKDKVFKGVMGVARYSCVFHIFLSPDLWSPKVLSNTVAHELNHTIFYYHHYNDFNNYTLLDEMLLEGLAENFREQVVDKTLAPWAIALTQKEAFKVLNSMDKQILSSKNSDIIKGVLFGNDRYEHWTGYSVGYWLVKELIRKKPNLSWNEIMKLQSWEILKIVKE